MDTGKLRAWWSHCQGLDGVAAGSAAGTLGRTGWARSVGGSGPYLGLYARAGLSREAVDAAVARLEVHELPSVRGCTYVLPAADFALGLRLGAGAPEGELAAAVKHLRVTGAEIEGLCEAVTGVLGERPLDPAAIKAATGGAVRGLGEAGKKRGTATTLPLALGLLQARGAIRRVPVNGRLDQQRYGYVAWGLDLGEWTAESARAELARRYFGWAGPASMVHFRWFSGFTATAAKAAVAGLGLRPVDGTDLLWTEATAAEYARFTAPEEPSYALVAGIDGIHLLHRDFGRLLDPADAQRPELTGPKALGALSDSPAHMIVDRGRLVGLWEFDTAAQEIVRQTWVAPDAELRAAVASAEAFVRDQLGDARSFSLDSPKSRAPRIAALRAGR
ncbi:DNA glycosylase AlkZ-like family protein [Streptomyces sp. RKAG293]|uniref:DNA glycosylase AlkZ-like family protein n=1 Tax=Streptomyces sp. RKAG293 TaxID=2893403 RepID=UPI002034A2EB|nr:crosslink repair DNA glycosylase YcaQ family protein [Streptomyces sp. RKAG293]MCM2419917.1 winged helix DNA-binding domain-containing protein [Streptomyces sp. RKAG293]